MKIKRNPTEELMAISDDNRGVLIFRYFIELSCHRGRDMIEVSRGGRTSRREQWGGEFISPVITIVEKVKT